MKLEKQKRFAQRRKEENAKNAKKSMNSFHQAAPSGSFFELSLRLFLGVFASLREIAVAVPETTS
jgi:hypothetical protein